jgi:hypothetical protein
MDLLVFLTRFWMSYIDLYQLESYLAVQASFDDASQYSAADQRSSTVRLYTIRQTRMKSEG